MSKSNHYTTLEVSQTASQAEIKQAYRRLAKQLHPDTNSSSASHEQIAQLNVAYEILGDPFKRQSYDRQINHASKAAGFDPAARRPTRQERTAEAQKRYRQRQSSRDSDELFKLWLKQVYQPIIRWLNLVLKPLKSQINALAADPFDDELLEAFQAYLEECRDYLQKAQQAFSSRPNPPNLAGVAAHLYYCLNQVSDGIDELERFTTSYDDHYLHTGQELFRIATGLRREAQAAVREIA
ncbi:MAG: DnaJ domain-containing protein [Timaviella obliquedivisa GSE-PSE-MK23-08B]|jgi:molecular chaperone DnaJ|nr:DnaJ domain-containing protein [Timaviella obliquedivisa GSE-PSE-MK23-08B]